MVDAIRKLLDSIEEENPENHITNQESPSHSISQFEINSQNSKTSSDQMNSLLDQIINKNRNRIVVFGVGGGGCNAINRLSLTSNYKGTTTIAANTDAIHLRDINSTEKILLGINLTEGLGAGNDPVIGHAAAQESEPLIESVVKNSDMVFVTTGFGGGTGTGAAPHIAQIAKKAGALVVGICTLPFEMEGENRAKHAMEGLKKFYKYCDTVIVIPNEKLMQIVPNLPINLAFEVADEILVRAVKGIVNLIITPAYVNVDFADIRQVLKQGGSSVIGMGEGEGDNRIDMALRESLSNSLLDIKIMDCKAALINIAGGSNLSLEEVRMCVETITHEMEENSEIIWGTHIDPSLGDKIRVTTILSGVESPYQFLENSEILSSTEETELDDNLLSIWE